ncbi:hypothetical protein, partial [Streptomyces sp. NPDC005859]|uniref:hypothetical protein n=1 Tax=Streptomyces sp. NPDC005859 TaxID=3157170 RepID=UPI0033E26117
EGDHGLAERDDVHDVGGEAVRPPASADAGGRAFPSGSGACTLQPHTVTRAAVPARTAIDLRIRMTEMFPPDDAWRTDRHCGDRKRRRSVAATL